MGSSPKVQPPPAPDYERDILKYVSGYSKALPTVLGFEKSFRPEFQALNLQDISSFLGGVGGQEGLFGLSRTATQEAAQQLGAARKAELRSISEQAPLSRGVMESLSPEQAAIVRASAQEAERARASAQGITPQEQRMYQQTARAAAQASGRLGGNQAIASEIMGRENVMAAKRAEAAQARGQAYNEAQGFYTQPGLAMLGTKPLSYTSGQDVLGIGMSGMKQGTPGLFNPDVGVNLGAGQGQNKLQADMANAQAKAAQQSSIYSSAASAAILAGTLAASDRRLKTDIKKVGKTNSGLPIYTYKYKGDNKTQMGVMAQDVEKKTPKAVKEIGGFKAVNYKLIK